MVRLLHRIRPILTVHCPLKGENFMTFADIVLSHCAIVEVKFMQLYSFAWPPGLVDLMRRQSSLSAVAKT